VPLKISSLETRESAKEEGGAKGGQHNEKTEKGVVPWGSRESVKTSAVSKSDVGPPLHVRWFRQRIRTDNGYCR